MNDPDLVIDNLNQQTTQIIKGIKDEFTEIAQWLEENGVDLSELGENIKSISAIAFVSIGIVTGALALSAVKPEITHPSDEKERTVMLLNSDTLPNPTNDEKEAIEVWNKYAPYIEEASEKYKVDPKVIFATIMVESRGNPSAYRYEPSINDASYGLGQILYGTAVLIGYDGEPAQLNDPRTNIDMIARYHRYNLDVYGELDVDQLATAYNAGNPYTRPIYGHVEKFDKWYKIVSALNKLNGEIS